MAIQQPRPARPNLDDYVAVHERIAAFYAKHPEGSLQSEFIVHTDSLIVMQAKAYRTPTDERPGIGHSSIEVPGRTPYTRGSEVENCETSAWGRAIASLGFEVKRGIATAEEVENKRDDGSPRAAPRPKPVPVTAPPSVVTAEGLSDEEWAGLVEPNSPPTLRAVDTSAGMSSRDFFDAADGAGIDRKLVTKTARQMYGDAKWKVTELTDSERAALWEELTA